MIDWMPLERLDPDGGNSTRRLSEGDILGAVA